MEVDRWFSSNGDSTFSIDHNLTEDSIVMDLGAFVGMWGKRLLSKKSCKLYLLEPVSEFYNKLCENFENTPNVRTKKVGIATTAKCVNMVLNGDASKIIEDTTGCEVVQLDTLENIMRDLEINRIDLLQINVEGAEFDVLEDWLDSGIIQKIEKIQIQFHRFPEIPNVDQRREGIRQKLSDAGYEIKYDFAWVWECWEKKSTVGTVP